MKLTLRVVFVVIIFAEVSLSQTQDHAICFGQTMRVWMSNRGVFGQNALGNSEGGCDGFGLRAPINLGVDLFGAGLWIGAIIDTSRDGIPQKVKAVTTTYQGWANSLFEMFGHPDGRDSFFVTSIDQPNGKNIRWFDDDGDGRSDEDELDALDNDNDGRIDEDYGAVSEMDAYVAYYDTVNMNVPWHIPLGIKVWQKAYSWKNRIKAPILPIEFYVINVGTKTLDSVYLGFFVDADIFWCNYLCTESSGFLAEVRTGYSFNTAEQLRTLIGVATLNFPNPSDTLGFVFKPFFGPESPTTDLQRYEFMSEGAITPDQFPSFGDTRFLLSVGPMRNFMTGDTLKLAIAFVSAVGVREGKNNLYDNASVALTEYKREFRPHLLPFSPVLQIKTEFNKVTLDWNWYPNAGKENPEEMWDYGNEFLSTLPDTHWRRRNPPSLGVKGGRIFEGYRLYRSEYPTFDSSHFVLMRQYDVVDELNREYQVGLQHTFVDSFLTLGKTYWYAVTSYTIPEITIIQRPDPNNAGSFVTDTISTAEGLESPISENAIAVTISNQFHLFDAYPNPFNSQTLISYDLPASTFVRLRVYNVLGEVVARLVEEPQTVGRHSVTWDASSLGSGVYFYQIRAGNFVATKKLLLIR